MTRTCPPRVTSSSCYLPVWALCVSEVTHTCWCVSGFSHTQRDAHCPTERSVMLVPRESSCVDLWIHPRATVQLPFLFVVVSTSEEDCWVMGWHVDMTVSRSCQTVYRVEAPTDVPTSCGAPLCPHAPALGPPSFHVGPSGVCWCLLLLPVFFV